MTANFVQLSEDEILKEVKDLMLNEGIRPQPEYIFFSKFLATSTDDCFLENEEKILHLINSHGVQLINDVKYYVGKSNLDISSEDTKKQVPVINLKHCQVQDFNDIMVKLKELPSEWTVLQITKKFSVCDFIRTQEMPEIHLTRFACGDLAKRVYPYSVTTEDKRNFQENIFSVLQNLIEMRKEYYNLGRTNKKLCEAYYKTNSELESFIKELELYVLGPFICLFQGRLEDSVLEKEIIGQVQQLINSFCEKEGLEMLSNSKKIDLIYQLTCAAHLIKNKALFNTLKMLLYSGYKQLANSNELMMLTENIKLLNLSKSCAIKRVKRNPLILIVDSEFEMVPWEMLTILSGQPVCRISSLPMLYSLYKYHEPRIQKGFRIVEIDSTYCLINPSQDLKECEKEMKEFLRKRIQWAEIKFGKIPHPKDLLSKIEEYSAYLYCGHGSGIQYLKAKDLKKAFVKGLVLLFGCSSNIPKNCGGRTPHQNHTYTYITNGCPCIIGCIQDLSSPDADMTCKEMLSNIMPAVVTEEEVVLEPKEPDVLKALATGRLACPKFWSKSAFVARGIPSKTAIGDANLILPQMYNFCIQ